MKNGLNSLFWEVENTLVNKFKFSFKLILATFQETGVKQLEWVQNFFFCAQLDFII